MKRKPGESLREIKNTIDSLVEDVTVTKEDRDRRWEENLEKCDRPPLPAVAAQKRNMNGLSHFLKMTMK